MHIFWFQIDLCIKGDWCLCLCHELSSFCLISSVGSVMIYFQFVVYSPRGLSFSHDLSSFFLISSVCLSFTIYLHFFYLSSLRLSVTIFFTFPNILWRVFHHTRFTVTEQFKEWVKINCALPKSTHLNCTHKQNQMRAEREARRWEHPKINVPKLYSGPIIQYRLAAHREA